MAFSHFSSSIVVQTKNKYVQREKDPELSYKSLKVLKKCNCGDVLHFKFHVFIILLCKSFDGLKYLSQIKNETKV